MDFDRWAFLGSLLLFIQICSGLQCPTCTYVTHTGHIPYLAKKAVNTLLNAVQAPECKQSLPDAIPEIQEETCAVTSGKESRCSYYAGTITMNYNTWFGGIDFPLKIYHHGCMQFSRANVPSNGCYSRNNVAEDNTFLKHIWNRDLENFVGNVCLCSDTYCQTSGANDVLLSNSASYVILLLVQCVALLYHAF